MPDNEKEYILLLWEENICRTCGNTILEGTRIGSGSKSDGGFYGLDCYAKYYEAEL